MPDWALPASEYRGYRTNQSTISFCRANGVAKRCVDSPYSKIAFTDINKGDDHYEY